MKVEHCIVDVRRRTAGGCLDLACVFVREYALPIFQLTAMFAIPSLVLTWWLLSNWGNLALEAFFVWSLFSALYGGALVAGIGPQVFGQPFGVGRSCAGLWSRLPLYLCWMSGVRALQYLLSFCLFFPALLIVPWTGFLAEVVFLERLPMRQVRRRVHVLVQGTNWFWVLGRLCLLLMFGCILSSGLYVGITFLASFMFNVPAPLTRLGLDYANAEDIVVRFLSDPANAVVIQLCLWIANPLCRLTWFFFYLDGRIRQECWDLDVAFQVEAKRLETLE